MRVLIFGATGMVGQGVLRECLEAPDVELAVALGRTSTGITRPGFREIMHRNLWNYAAIESSLAGFDACFFCLGVASNGVSKMDYERITYDLTIAAAKTLSRLNPQMTFIYVSGSGTDSTGQGWMHWARVKGRTENALLQLPSRPTCSVRDSLSRWMDSVEDAFVPGVLFARQAALSAASALAAEPGVIHAGYGPSHAGRGAERL